MKIDYEFDMFLETEKVKQIYPIIRSIFEAEQDNIYYTASKLNEHTLMFDDVERLILAIKLIEDFPNEINNKKLFIDTFTRRL